MIVHTCGIDPIYTDAYLQYRLEGMLVNNAVWGILAYLGCVVLVNYFFKQHSFATKLLASFILLLVVTLISLMALLQAIPTGEPTLYLDGFCGAKLYFAEYLVWSGLGAIVSPYTLLALGIFFSMNLNWKLEKKKLLLLYLSLVLVGIILVPLMFWAAVGYSNIFTFTGQQTQTQRY